MSQLANQFTLSLRAWPPKDDKSTALSSLISRINSERGNFRDITEDILEEEIRQNDTQLDSRAESTNEEETDTEADRLKEVNIARDQILTQLEQAHNISMVALDFVSLLLSKDTPVQASLSISAALREAVSLGTIGSDKLHEPRVTSVQRKESFHVAKGWKLASLSDSAESLINSASRLNTEVEKETTFWRQVSAVNARGWAVCRLPQEKHTLGVRFGFSESSPTFRNRSLAALRRAVDGTISLGLSIDKKRIRIRIRTGGIISGESLHHGGPSDQGSVETQILAARNSIFDEELWQELNREARILANHGVRLNGEEISCLIAPSKQLIIDLVEIEEANARLDKKEDAATANMISLALHLLLSYAHRQNLNRRSQHPPPLGGRPPPEPIYFLLRGIIVFLQHQKTLGLLQTLFTSVSEALLATGITIDHYSQKSGVPDQENEASMELGPEQIIQTLVFRLTAELSLPITSKPLQTLSVTLRTNTDPRFALEPQFRITASEMLEKACRPPSSSISIQDVKSYVLWAVGCAIAEVFVTAGDDTDDAPNDNGWQKTHDPTVLRKMVNEEGDYIIIAFRLALTMDEAVEIRVIWRHMTPEKKERISKTLTWHSKKVGPGNIRQIIENLVAETQNSE